MTPDRPVNQFESSWIWVARLKLLTESLIRLEMWLIIQVAVEAIESVKALSTPLAMDPDASPTAPTAALTNEQVIHPDKPVPTIIMI
jgi:hypothetical protein